VLEKTTVKKCSGGLKGSSKQQDERCGESAVIRVLMQVLMRKWHFRDSAEEVRL
jgi:hypothetical protein